MPRSLSKPEIVSETWGEQPLTLGRLVLVVAAEHAGPGLLLTAVRRRLTDLSDIEFPKLITTRRNGPSDAEASLTREAFQDLERDGHFLLTWNAAGHSFGLPIAIRAKLDEGRTVVIAAPADIVPELHESCPELHVVRLTGGVDSARRQLTPQACLRRMMGPKLAKRLEGQRLRPRTDAISGADDMATAVRALSNVLSRISEERNGPEPLFARDRAGPPAAL